MAIEVVHETVLCTYVKHCHELYVNTSVYIVLPVSYYCVDQSKFLWVFVQLWQWLYVAHSIPIYLLITFVSYAIRILLCTSGYYLHWCHSMQLYCCQWLLVITRLFTYRVAAFSTSFSAVQDDVSANSHDSAITAAHFECSTITLYVVNASTAIVDWCAYRVSKNDCRECLSICDSTLNFEPTFGRLAIAKVRLKLTTLASLVTA